MPDLAFRTLGGEGRDIVLIHGFASDRLSWGANAPALMAAGRVHVLDLPGHGESSPDTGDGSLASIASAVAATLKANGISQAHLIGHSLGGAVAINIAANEPSLVSSLVLIAPLGLGLGVDVSFLNSITSATEIEPTLEALRRLVVKPQLINKLLAKRLLDQLSRNGVRDELRKIALAIPAAEKHDIPRLLREISETIPRLVIWGSDDSINPRADFLPCEFGLAPADIELTGHLPHIERPDLANGMIIAFLKTCEQRVPARAAPET